VSVYRNFVGGEWIESRSGDEIANTSDVIGTQRLSTREEARAAVEAALKAQKAWRKVPAPERGRVLLRALRILGERRDELARSLTREEGKILREARGEVNKAMNVLEFMAGEGMRLCGETYPSELPNTFNYTLRQPMGVVACITPWNFPVAIPIWKIAPALVAGNAVVLKPAEQTPECAKLVAQVFEQAGLPPGVLNVIFGRGEVVGDELVRHKDVAAVSFTGSTEVGTLIYETASRGLKKVQCEMGGKNPVVVLDDGDVDLAVEAAAQGAFGSTGQRCTATSRVIVDARVADEFVTKLKARAEKVRVGDGLDEATDMGPSIDEPQWKKVLEAIDRAKTSNAKLVTGGGAFDDAARSRGYFTKPTVFDEVKKDDMLAQEEVFGPVLAITHADGMEDAIAAANCVRYGLTASIYSRDPSAILKFVDEIECGIVHVNSPTVGGEAQLPFGGIKHTGIGPREQGKTAIDFYTEIKTVYYDYTGQARKGNLY
jgi:alpha-ketoglutaric semialdehyde dehydrogenase